MSIEFRNDIICNSNPNIMEYLIQKLESRQKHLSKYANIINTIDSFESFYQKKKDIFLLFQDLEEELNQASLAIKALVVQNKALAQESINTNDIENNYKKLLQENNYLLKENCNYAKKLEELNNKSKSPKKLKSPSFSIGSKSRFNKYQSLNKNNIENKNIINKTIKNKNNINNKKKENSNKYTFNYDLDLNEINQLKNAKNIMKDMKNNKNKLKEVINEHFGRIHTQVNRNNLYLKNV